MTIRELTNKFKNAPNDTNLARDIELYVNVTFVPEDPLAKYTIVEDETGRLEAVPKNKEIFHFLKSQSASSRKLKLKGRLDKTEFGNTAFLIEEILN